MQIRQLVGADAASYYQLRLRMLREHPEAFTSSFEEEAEKPVAWAENRIGPHAHAPHDFLLGAFGDDGGLVGTVGLSVERRAKERHKALLFGMYVAPEAASTGIGRALLATCLERARSTPGLDQVRLTVTASSARARRFYEAAGFRTFGVEERAIVVDGVPYGKAHMALHFATAAPAPDRGSAIALSAAMARLPESSAARSVELFRHGTLQLKWYAPRGTDLQQPHARDEVYVVGRGSGEFVHDDRRIAFGAGDFLFAAAGVPHKFEHFTPDLGLWVLFYGPEGGDS